MKFRLIVPLLIISTSLLLTILTTFDKFYNGESQLAIFQFICQYRNPLIHIQSISILLLFLRLKPTYMNGINSIAKNVFAVYLLTEGIGYGLYSWWASFFDMNFLYGQLFILIIFALAILIDKLRVSIFNKLLNVKKIIQ